MPDHLSMLAYAKLNLSLDITGKLPNGYHTISTIMQSVDLFDTVSVTRVSENDNGAPIHIICNCDELSTDETNTAYKAAAEFFKFTGISGSVSIKVNKAVPLCAGLGGGSADAAAVIVAMNELFGTALDDDAMMNIAEEVGMDVPFCIRGGTALAEGMGSILTPLPDIGECAFLLISAGEKPSTSEMYGALDRLPSLAHPDTAQIVNSICEGEFLEAAPRLGNVFDPLWSKAEHIRAKLIENGAVGAALTGSGPTVFGVFEDEDAAREARQALEEDFDDMILCLPTDCGVREK